MADRIPVEDGKYTIVIDQGRVSIDRYDQRDWKSSAEIMDSGLGKMLIALAYETQELREQLSDSRPPF